MVHDFGQKAPLEDQQVDALLDDLEMRCRTDVSAARSMTEVRRKVAVTIRPADVIARKLGAILGVTVELRRQGMSCMAVEPLAVGSVFHLAFAREQLDLPPVLAVCDRCSMLNDTSFEMRFKFAQEIDLPALDPAQGS